MIDSAAVNAQSRRRRVSSAILPSAQRGARGIGLSSRDFRERSAQVELPAGAYRTKLSNNTLVSQITTTWCSAASVARRATEAGETKAVAWPHFSGLK